MEVFFSLLVSCSEAVIVQFKIKHQQPYINSPHKQIVMHPYLHYEKCHFWAKTSEEIGLNTDFVLFNRKACPT